MITKHQFRFIGAVVLGAAAVAWFVASRLRPAACPYAMRFSLDLPRPFLRRETLLAMLDPQPGERLLEIGPGTGYYSLAVARALSSHGRLDLLDIQQAMLDETMRRAAVTGITNLVPAQGDAATLPYVDAAFDGAFLVATLGEVPDPDAALREVRRVLAPGGRLVVGEGQPDPHMVRLSDLRDRAAAAGFRFETHQGGRFGYLARFVAA